MFARCNSELRKKTNAAQRKFFMQLTYNLTTFIKSPICIRLDQQLFHANLASSIIRTAIDASNPNGCFRAPHRQERKSRGFPTPFSLLTASLPPNFPLPVNSALPCSPAPKPLRRKRTPPAGYPQTPHACPGWA